MQLHHLTTENQLCVTVTEGCQEAFSNGGVIWLTDRCCATINGVGARYLLGVEHESKYIARRTSTRAYFDSFFYEYV